MCTEDTDRLTYRNSLLCVSHPGIIFIQTQPWVKFKACVLKFTSNYFLILMWDLCIFRCFFPLGALHDGKSIPFPLAPALKRPAVTSAVLNPIVSFAVLKIIYLKQMPFMVVNYQIKNTSFKNLLLYLYPEEMYYLWSVTFTNSILISFFFSISNALEFVGPNTCPCILQGPTKPYFYSSFYLLPRQSTSVLLCTASRIRL